MGDMTVSEANLQISLTELSRWLTAGSMYLFSFKSRYLQPRESENLKPQNLFIVAVETLRITVIGDIKHLCTGNHETSLRHKYIENGEAQHRAASFQVWLQFM